MEHESEDSSNTEMENESEDSSDFEMEYEPEDYEYECCEEENYWPAKKAKEKGSMKPYRVLSFRVIRGRQDKAMESVSSLCSLSQAESRILLQHFKWRVPDLLEQWFHNEQKVRKDSGLFQSYYSICMDEHFITEMKALACAHYFCNNCWMNYIQTSTRENGIGCLSLRCPQPKCGAVVDEDTVLCLITEEQNRKKYEQFLVRTYVGIMKESNGALLVGVSMLWNCRVESANAMM
ncbi:hypothetical protein SUGI_0558130 [Cryptomeria japonica]|nr:hypothetical protein SUGI_0558130 [Cryptomeria japonica]